MTPLHPSFLLISHYLSCSFDEHIAELPQIRDRTPVEMVIGFKGEAELFTTAYLAMNFWWQHLAGFRYNDAVGGYNAETSFSRAIWLFESLLDDVHFTQNIAISLILGMFLGPALELFLEPFAFTAEHIFSRILATIFKVYITESNFNLWIASMTATLNNFDCLVGSSDYIPSLTSITGSGGGTGGKIIITPD